MMNAAPHANLFADDTLADVSGGFIAGTRIATTFGWRGVEAIAAGDAVLTFDSGVQRVVHVSRQIVWTGGDLSDRALWPLHVPAGALGNGDDMAVMPEQAVLIESDAAEEALGDPFALIPAAALDGFRGITPTAPLDRIEVITLHFAQDQIVFGNLGALVHCPARADLVCGPPPAGYHCLTLAQADLLVSLMEDDTHALPPAAPLDTPYYKAA